MKSDWLRAADLLAAGTLPGDSAEARRARLRRELGRLQTCGSARKRGGEWTIAPDAELCGRPARAWLHGALPERLAGRDLPSGHAAWSDKDRERFLNTGALVDAFARFCVAHRAWTADVAATAFAAQRAGDLLPPGPTLNAQSSTLVSEWCAQRGLSCTARRLREYRRRLPLDGNVDRRGTGKGAAPLPDQRLRDLFLSRMLHQNQFDCAAAWRDTRDQAAELGLPMRSLRWWQCWYKEQVPHYAKAYHRQKPDKFEADDLPKIHREYADVAPLEWVSLDGHDFNILCRVPDARRGWRQARPVVTGVLDVRTRYFVGWDVRGTENSDGILAGLKMMHREWGCADHVYLDNGTAYKASVGRRTRRGVSYADPRIGGLCAQTHAALHHALKHHGWAKMIESIWNHVVREFERYWPSWWGNSPANRPEQAEKLRIDQLPTIDDVRAAWAEYLRVYHATPQNGDAMNGLTPALAMEQFRTQTRKLDPGVLDFLCCRLAGPRVVSRDGVTWNNLRYGHFDVDVWKFKGRRVWLRIDPDQAEYIWLCDESGAPLCRASNRVLTGVTQEEVREAARIRAQMRRIAREYHDARDFLLDSNIRQIMRTKAHHAELRQAEQRATLPAPAETQVTIARPDLVAPVRAGARRGRMGQAAGLSSRAAEEASRLAQLAAELTADDPAADARHDELAGVNWLMELADAG